MQFILTHQRQTLGQQIGVTVLAGPGQSITQVTTQFDGFALAADSLPQGSVHYERTFDGQSAGSGDDHTLVVTALDQNSNPESATKKWTDER